MDALSDFETFQDSLSAALVSTTRSSTQLNATDLPFQRSYDPDVATSLDKQNARLLSLAQRLLENATSSPEIVGPKLEDADAIDGSWRGVVDIVDSLLEKADTSLDEYTGAIKRLSPGTDQAPPSRVRQTLTNAFRPRDLPKPQSLFEHVPQNKETGGFRPLLSSKPHAKVPLEESTRLYKDQQGNEQYPNPYRKEIESYRYPSSMYAKAEPMPYFPFEDTTATFVDSPEALAMMLAELKTAKEIAIDLEHHDQRSYVGVVSLMQISTRNQDWIVDTLKPWRRRLECLNEVFADPNIIKVLHGAHMDIIWLQRDLGLYIVGLFDTHHAARALGYAGGSLAFLLQKFVNFHAQKQYQIADWRIRPLPAQMFDYARSDTHFLLYIFDNMRNELIDRSDFSNPENDKIQHVLEKSTETALQAYQHPIYDFETGQGPVGWYKLLSRTPASFSKEQFAVFKAVHQWRDQIARQNDDSTHYVMANHAVFSIARALPEERAALLAVAQPTSPVLRDHVDELLAIIVKAKAEGASGPEMTTVLAQIEQSRPRRSPLPAQRPASTASVSVIKTAPMPVSLNTLPIRSDSSQFWGSVIPNNVWEQRRSISTSNISLALPLPQLTAEVFNDPSDSHTSINPSNAGPAAMAEHAFVPKGDRVPRTTEDEVFIIKQLGGKKRKRAEEVETPSRSAATAPPIPSAFKDPNNEEMEDYGITLPIPEEIDEASRKAEIKATKKEAKRLRKAQKALQKAHGEEDAAPFDYANAPSVLKGNDGAEAGKEAKEKKKKGKEFNPYARAMDAPKGLGRTQKESAGRSKTFSK